MTKHKHKFQVIEIIDVRKISDPLEADGLSKGSRLTWDEEYVLSACYCGKVKKVKAKYD